ncbi:MAG: tRNA (N(6)-L-threonylcarbamoyladenosine(37)-C(2))-methylthiotransferase MtaB [Eubacteriales bacterium]|nr:tRNA (N(6)-L-threonylcarbamoyladenosine(37)-C(2))-methylthiotransferase MtaB [Eubacteriales bacterium]
MDKLKFAIHTLGCKVNTYESDIISEQMKKYGFIETEFNMPADIYIINTCTVTNMADRKSRQMLHKAKKMNPKAAVVAVGCYVDAAMQNPKMQEILSESEIDLLITNKEKERTAQIIIDYLSKNTDELFNIEDAFGSCYFEKINTVHKSEADNSSLSELDDHTRAFIKVQDGCNQFCSYCIIPYVRGRIRSRAKEDILEEIKALSKKGVKEFIITGIHLSSYGKDFFDKSVSEEKRIPGDDIMNQGTAPILSLISEINSLPEVKRIRLGSLEPRLISKEFIEELRKNDKLCPHFHLSLQSGCDKILKSMNRHYTKDEYRESCRLLREAYEHPAITTDVIAGFPGETEDDFAETLDFIKEIGFYEAHVFKYSIREGTVAAKFKNQVNDKIKNERSRMLIEAAEENSGIFRKYYLKKKVSFIAEQHVIIDGEKYISGYTDEYVRCLKKSEAFTRGKVESGIACEIINKKDIDESLLLI